MPHFPKPSFRKDRGPWYIQVAGKQYNLGGGSEEEAYEAAVDLKKKLRLEESYCQILCSEDVVRRRPVRYSDSPGFGRVTHTVLTTESSSGARSITIDGGREARMERNCNGGAARWWSGRSPTRVKREARDGVG